MRRALLLIFLALPSRAQDAPEAAWEAGRDAFRDANRRLLAPLGRTGGDPARLRPRQTAGPRAPFPLVDLHAHLFMDRGMSPLFYGGFDEPIAARDWDDRFASQANRGSLEASNLGVVVVALYAHPVFAPDRRASIRKQIRDAEAFAASAPGWVLARTPAQGLAAHRAGNRVLVLSVEGAEGVVDDEEGLREFVDRLGVRIVTFAHLTDDHLSGAALFNQPWANPGAASRRRDGVDVNPRGLTPAGRRVAQALLRRGVWLDLSHAPDAAQAELLPMLRRAGQPALFTHGSLRRFRPVERAVSDEALRAVRDTGGLVGLVPSEEVLEDTLPLCPASCRDCRGGVWALARQFNVVVDEAGPGAAFLGSDHNGAMTRLAPHACPTGTSLDRRGYVHIGQSAELWVALRRAGAKTDVAAFHGAERFFAAWERAYASREAAGAGAD